MKRENMSDELENHIVLVTLLYNPHHCHKTHQVLNKILFLLQLHPVVLFSLLIEPNLGIICTLHEVS